MVNPEACKNQRRPRPRGHVVAVRITAENADAGSKPSSGSLQELNFRSSANVWGYFSVNSAGGLHEFADSQFGHIFAYGGDLSESQKNMVVAVKELSISVQDLRSRQGTTLMALRICTTINSILLCTFCVVWSDYINAPMSIVDYNGVYIIPRIR